jgi:hypothetical protein
MSRGLALKQKQITALAKGAAAAGCFAEVKIGDVVIRIIPGPPPQEQRPIDDPTTFETFEQYAAWRDGQGAGGG